MLGMKGGASVMTDGRERVVEVARSLAAEVHPDLDLRELGLGADLERDLGLGSLERVELLRRLESGLGHPVPERAVFQARTVADLVAAALAEPASPAARVPSIPVPEGPGPGPALEATSLVEVLDRQAARGPDRLALLLESGPLTYAELREAVARRATWLYQQRVEPGDRVALMLPTGPDFLALFFGTLWAGAVPVPLYPPVRIEELAEYLFRQRRILENARPSLLVLDPQARALGGVLRGLVPDLPAVEPAPQVPPDEPAPPWPAPPGALGLIQYTSGSTASPRGVALSHANLLANLRAYGERLGVHPGDVAVSWLPLYHDMGLIGALLGSLYHGVPLVLDSPETFLARPSRWLWALSRHGGTLSAAPNFAYELCARRIPEQELEGLDLSRWRGALNGAEPVRPDTLERFAARFEPYGFRREAVLPCYGLAEASVALALPPPGRGPLVDRVARWDLETSGRARPAELQEESLEFPSCGTPLPGMEIRVVDPSGRELPERRQGRLLFRGPSAMQGYFRNPEATAAVRDATGFVDTGDLGSLAEGELYVTGRTKDLILKAGRNLHPRDLEAAAAEVPGARRGCVAAFGAPGAEAGTEELVVVVESRLRDPAQRRDLAAAVTARVAAEAGLPPDRVLVVGPRRLPKTPSGKLRRSACRARYLDGTLEHPPSWLAQAARLVAAGLAPASLRLARGVGRGLFRGWCWFVVGASGAGIAMARGLPDRLAARARQRMARGILRSFGMRIRITGKVAEGPLLLVANHASYLDALLVSAALDRPAAFAVAPWVSRDPVFGLLLRGVPHVVVSRGDPTQAVAELQELGQVMRPGGCLVAFPEGGFEAVPGLRPFAMGVFRAAAEAGARVQPVALAGTRRALPYERSTPRPGWLHLTFGEPLGPTGADWPSVVELAREARSAIARHCGEPLVERRLSRSD